jgi:hypothetical protein
VSGDALALLRAGWCCRDGGAFSPAIRELRLSAAAPAMTTASASTSPARGAALVRMCSPNKNTPSRLAASGSKMVNPGWEAASGPAASACEASSMVTTPAASSTYSDQAEKTAPGPPPRCALSSLMTAAMNPHAIPVAAPSTAARRPLGAPERRPRPNATARAASTTPTVTSPASSHEDPGACSRPPDGAASRRNAPIPADIAAAASKSRHVTRRVPAMAR